MDPARWLNAGLQQLLVRVLTFAQSTLARVGDRYQGEICHLLNW